MSALTPSGVAKQLDNCSYCPKMCRHACPVSTTTGRETLIPQAKMHQLNQLRRGKEAWSQDAAEPVWGCTGCRQCTTYCDHGNEPGLVLFRGRAEAQKRGVGHPRLDGYAERFRKRDRRLVDQLRAHGGDRCAADGVVGFWPGCDAVDKGLPDVTAALDIFDRLSASRGAAPVALVEAGQVCAGYPLLAGGFPDMFRWHAGKVAIVLKRFQTVIVNCSACLYTLRALYPAEGLALATEIVSVAEHLARAVRDIPEPAEKKVVYYHDPCYLARYVGVIEQPRAVLARVAEVRELAWSGTDTECCGGGGLLPKTMPEVADAMARRRLRDLADRGGGTLVTGCATCAFMLQRNAPNRVEVHELARYVADVTDDSPPQTRAPGR